jgi:hypothetical protein
MKTLHTLLLARKSEVPNDAIRINQKHASLRASTFAVEILVVKWGRECRKAGTAFLRSLPKGPKRGRASRWRDDLRLRRASEKASIMIRQSSVPIKGLLFQRCKRQGLIMTLGQERLDGNPRRILSYLLYLRQ